MNRKTLFDVIIYHGEFETRYENVSFLTIHRYGDNIKISMEHSDGDEEFIRYNQNELIGITYIPLAKLLDKHPE